VFQIVKPNLSGVCMRLTLVCHASTSAVRTAAFPLDEPLDPQGQAKAAALAGALRGVDATLTSPALRARQTAAALLLDATVDPALRDIDVGRWTGRSFADVEGAEPEAVAAWASRPDTAPHGGESVVDLLARVAPWLAARGGQTGRIVAVTHQAVIRAAIVVAIDARPPAFWRIDIAPLCRVILAGDDGIRWTLRAIVPSFAATV
jgi:broad specificity phosphatase PhoE